MKMTSKMDLARESVEYISKRYDIPRNEILKLDMNENLFVHRAFLRQIMLDVVMNAEPRFYPLSEEDSLRQSIATLEMIDDNQILIGAGGDQVLDILFRSFRNLVDEIVTINPTFTMYEKLCRGMQIRIKSVPLKDDFLLNADEVLKTSADNSMILLCSPNNPTGNQFPKEEIIRVLKEFSGPVIVDEAYVDFANYRLTPELTDYDNLILVRSFSKSYALAGLRLGYLISNRRIVSRLMQSYQTPYPCSQISLQTATCLLRHQFYFETCNRHLKEVREWFLDQLRKIPSIRAFQSDSNFILLSLEKDWKSIRQKLLERGIITRGIGNVLGMQNCLRVTIGPKTMMQRFMDSFREVLS